MRIVLRAISGLFTRSISSFIVVLMPRNFTSIFHRQETVEKLRNETSF